jgi:hypothetical protein
VRPAPPKAAGRSSQAGLTGSISFRDVFHTSSTACSGGGSGVEDFIYPTEVAAIEVYSSNFVPSQFAHSVEPCETVVIWTKRKITFR